MKTKQGKEEPDKTVEEESVSEPKTRARKKASDTSDEPTAKAAPVETKNTKEVKKTVAKAKALVKKKPLGIRKTLRSKKVIATKDKLKNVIKQVAKRGRKPLPKPEPSTSEKDDEALIPESEIKTEPGEEAVPASNSRSSSPKTAQRRQRLSSDLMMMKSVLGDSPSSLVVGPRTSPYSMRSERSNSPSLSEGKGLRSGKPRKAKNNLLNEVVMKEQKKRRRLLSDSKVTDPVEGSEETKKMKRGRSCSRDGSEISKCSDITESDISLNETLSNDADSKELNKKLDKPKTDLDVDIENNIQISTLEKVPSLNDSKSETKTDDASVPNAKNKKKTSLRSTSIDSDNNNSSNRLMLETISSALDIDDKASLLLRNDNDSLFNTRNSILDSMSKNFMPKSVKKVRRGKKVATAERTSTGLATDIDDPHDTQESLTKEIEDLIFNLDQASDNENNGDTEKEAKTAEITPTDPLTKSVTKFYGLSKPLTDSNSIPPPDTPVKDKDGVAEGTPIKTDDSENIRLHYEEDSADKSADPSKVEAPYKVATIDKLMDRLKEFEEFDKKRQRQESETKDGKSVMVTDDVVLIPKSGDIKPLKDLQSVRSPEKPIKKENFLSCFENNSAISIVKRDHVRKSVDVDLPNSVTLIKRNSISRKESTGSNNSRESGDAISIFEKSLGKDVTLTEIRKSVDKSHAPHVDLNQFATLHPNTPNQSVGGVVLDSKQISITPRVTDTKRNSRESLSRKSSESGIDLDDKMATIEKIKSPVHLKSPTPIKSPSILSAPVSMKSPESQPMDAEPLAPPLENLKSIPEDLPLASETNKISEKEKPVIEEKPSTSTEIPAIPQTEIEPKTDIVTEKNTQKEQKDIQKETVTKPEVVTKVEVAFKKDKTPEKPVKVTRKSQENQPGPSNMIVETPESQERKENVLRTLGLLTHKAANEAKIEKQKEKERLYGGMLNNKNKAKSNSSDYTGTLKTVIKLNRGSKKDRRSLKMTFQKSKNRGGKVLEQGDAANEDDAYYTIERREFGAAGSADGGHRKTHYSNRLNHDQESTEQIAEPVEPTLKLVIPEKASSFSIHPGRLCIDQCFYCGGKFGLFDTPCHIAQMKSVERQKKVLDSEEKLTIDSCLCDACYRHVDRRANCPSYRKRPNKNSIPQNSLSRVNTKQNLQTAEGAESTETTDAAEAADNTENADEDDNWGASVSDGAICHTAGCGAKATKAIRRKWLIKMRSEVEKILRLEGDYPGLHTLPLCPPHYCALAPLRSCALCKRAPHDPPAPCQDYQPLNRLLLSLSIPVQFPLPPALCKACRVYAALLQRGQRARDTATYTRRLLQIYKVEVPMESENETEENNSMDDVTALFRQKKKKNKGSKRKSTDPEKSGDSNDGPQNEDKPGNISERSSERNSESSHDIREESNDSVKQNIEEDIESLISSNKIMVPKTNENVPEEMEVESPPIPVDKQTELQYLLQKQNNPAQFLQKPTANLTQKQRNLVKVSSTGIQKPGHQHRINEKNAKRIQKLGQIVTQQEKADRKDDSGSDSDKSKDSVVNPTKNIPLNDECTIETIPNKKSADITQLKSKWQMSESFTQVKKNLSELSKKLTIEKPPKKIADLKYSNPVKRLETNPSISVRELFPGEEEMPLQCNIEFNNVKGTTPEGWEKCNSTIQYDGETKRLWTELQRPYGNQSSFLRHLVLLEKFFRSGDLVLSHNAAPHAANYSDSVQSRLRAYDNVVTDAPRRNEPSISLIEFRKQKPAINGSGKSLLKSNQKVDNEPTKTIMPPPGPVKPKNKEAKKKQLPPELIAINTPNAQGRKAIQNVLHNIQQLVKGVSASDPIEVASAPLPKAKEEAPKEKKEATKVDTPKKQKSSSKPWRPTLMPITPENLAKISREPPQTAVDGRLLPSLVQVMSSGQRYHITLQDYNKMCIMRREKLQQIQDGEKPKRLSTETETFITEIHPTTILGNGATIKQNVVIDKADEKMAEMTQIGNAETMLKSVGLKNITIAPIPAKTATITSQTIPSPTVSSPSLLTTPIKIPQLGSSVSITSETILTPTNSTTATPMVMPKIPKSLTVIPQMQPPVGEGRP